MNEIISKNIRVRYPECLFVGDYSIIDDFCYISTRCSIGRVFHIASNCTIAGGKDSFFITGSFGSLASGVRILCASDDFVNDVSVALPKECEGIKNNILKGNVTLNNYVTIGANSFVPSNFKFEPWGVYAGTPIKLINWRDKSNVLRQVKEIKERLNYE